MAIIRPFHGVRYNPARIADLSAVISQPHDRVRHGLQDKYYDADPHNVVRLIKGRRTDGDGLVDNIYTRATDTYQRWLREGVLVREESPAFYLLRQTFQTVDGVTRTRQALIAALELSRFDEGIILPHERTLSASMEERLGLLRATSTNFGSVFVLYPGDEIDRLLSPIADTPPLVQGRELHENQVLQQFWAVTDPDLAQSIAEAMSPLRKLIIADGHHRYETALAYRDEMRALHLDAPADAAFNYRLVALVSMDSPGLVILPTHRLIRSDRGLDTGEMIRRAERYFDVSVVGERGEMERALAAVPRDALPHFGLYNGVTAVLRLRDSRAMDELAPDRSRDWRMLDASVVHELFIERVLGIDSEAVQRERGIEFLRDPEMGFRAVDSGQADCLLVLNPTRAEQVRACSVAGERMPQKSTDFYPKVISGLVMMPVGADQRL